jgi:hypothetical protein
MGYISRPCAIWMGFFIFIFFLGREKRGGRGVAICVCFEGFAHRELWQHLWKCLWVLVPLSLGTVGALNCFCVGAS